MAYVGKKQKRVSARDMPVTGDQYTFVALAPHRRAIIAYRTGKRDSANTDEFIQDLRQRVIGMPEISTDGFHAVPERDPRRLRQSRGAWHDRQDLQRNPPGRKRSRAPLPPAEVIAVEPRRSKRRAGEISAQSTSSGSNLTLRMS